VAGCMRQCVPVCKRNQVAMESRPAAVLSVAPQSNRCRCQPPAWWNVHAIALSGRFLGAWGPGRGVRTLGLGPRQRSGECSVPRAGKSSHGGDSLRRLLRRSVAMIARPLTSRRRGRPGYAAACHTRTWFTSMRIVAATSSAVRNLDVSGLTVDPPRPTSSHHGVAIPAGYTCTYAAMPAASHEISYFCH
jgi:hypothetical protein